MVCPLRQRDHVSPVTRARGAWLFLLDRAECGDQCVERSQATQPLLAGAQPKLGSAFEAGHVFAVDSAPILRLPRQAQVS